MLNFLAAVSGNGAGGGGSFESIATATGTGSSGTITFASIPNTFQHLQIRGIVRAAFANTNAWTGAMQFNSDTGSNYARHRLLGTGSSASATGAASQTSIENVFTAIGNNFTSGVMGVVIIDIHDYASTTKYKTTRQFFGLDGNTDTASFTVNLASGLWMSTNAINSVTLSLGSSNFTTSTTFALYGIKGA